MIIIDVNSMIIDVNSQVGQMANTNIAETFRDCDFGQSLLLDGSSRIRRSKRWKFENSDAHIRLFNTRPKTNASKRERTQDDKRETGES